MSSNSAMNPQAAFRRDRVFEFLIPKQVEDLDLSHGTALYLEDISVNFDGFQAIKDLNFYVNTGELRCLIGPNGAGKTTLMDIVTGKTRPDTGTAWFGQKINLLRMDEAEIAQAGIGRKFQKPTVFENLTVFDNLELSMAGTRKLWATFRAKLDNETMDRIEAMADTINLRQQLHAQAGSLSHGQKQWLEIGMLIMQNPVLLLVDEPAAGMTHQEMDRTVELLSSLAGDHAIVVVEHDMDFVRALNSPVTVLHQGSVLAEGSMSDIQSNADVMRVYLGTEDASC
ncbi:urea ABC transporter ATP-binding protein UrtD [Granulosicoccus antarcticus]|uniref:Lipopolysaccharide export system ATP-binding protein LptB n=1 Tax=Granulosicoccus antarcticus IMCC3135 TaxID=1192854 RepID=A0A2Z2NW07_9GAMM|nr:urea ABC transporter ATP-binding protein UrtD [Granulosicoccus antarcticus]ASJ75423.1 Lipopolysaccharide export system ATP-binding protein LptB [Granulosicoccus antarcticus IMCC3135]